MSIIDHIEFSVRDTEASRMFYQSALAPLGMGLVITVGAECSATGGPRYGLGRDGYPILWLHHGESPSAGTHIAFAASERSIVDAFYQTAIAAGGTDNGPPGVRQRYHSHYYAAYVLDPDGINVEVVCQRGPA
jgi:catechol 2,3-dioxygenase-like lactoylglutathione lyase family enzyme